MKILAVGGGSGGHVTPVVAVLRELRSRNPGVELRFWVDTGFAAQARGIIGSFDESLRVDTILSGKLRRYHHLTLMQHVLWPSLMWSNFKDGFKILAGTVQSVVKLIAWRPDVVFTKGGFVCLPVGIAAKLLRIPLVIHDSDAHPGLTNRVLAKWATRIATGAPLEYYNYPKSRSHYVGIPISDEFVPYSNDEQKKAKQAIGVDSEAPLIVITGGGLGARRLNGLVVSTLTELQALGSVILVAGAAQYEELRAKMPEDSERFKLFSFVTTMPQLLGAADLVVTRAGATTILELAALEKPTILVPNAALTGGHQLKNAAVYEDAKAAVVLDEDAAVKSPDMLVEVVKECLGDPVASRAMAKRFAEFSKPQAAADMADIILSASKS